MRMIPFMLADIGPYYTRGSAADHEVFVGPKGTFCTRNIKTGKAIQSVVPSGGTVLPVIGLTVSILNLGVSLLHRVPDSKGPR